MEVEALRDAKVPGSLTVSPFGLTPFYNPPSSIPPALCVILGIYSWPASVYNLNYLYGEMGSLHDSGNRILFVPSN